MVYKLRTSLLFLSLVFTTFSSVRSEVSAGAQWTMGIPGLSIRIWTNNNLGIQLTGLPSPYPLGADGRLLYRIGNEDFAQPYFGIGGFGAITVSLCGGFYWAGIYALSGAGIRIHRLFSINFEVGLETARYCGGGFRYSEEIFYQGIMIGAGILLPILR